MNYQQRVRPSGAMPMGSGTAVGNQTVGANLSTGFNVGGSATGPALVLIGITVLLVMDYIWTRGQQGGR